MTGLMEMNVLALAESEDLGVGVRPCTSVLLHETNKTLLLVLKQFRQ
jgi:hypothetical protein